MLLLPSRLFFLVREEAKREEGVDFIGCCAREVCCHGDVFLVIDGSICRPCMIYRIAYSLTCLQLCTGLCWTLCWPLMCTWFSVILRKVDVSELMFRRAEVPRFVARSGLVPVAISSSLALR